MIKLVNFLLLIETITDYNKSDIDRGNTPLDIYKICSCIRETFCLSYAIRKNNNLYLYFQHEKVLIKFEGISLRFLSSDERSQALLLKKALDKAPQYEGSHKNGWLKSTPGIYIRKFNNNLAFILWLNTMELKKIACVANSISVFEFPFLAHMYDLPPIKKFEEVGHLNKFFYIIALPPHINTLLINFLSSVVQVFPSMLENITLIPLKKIKSLEDKILYINFRIDQQESKNYLNK